MGLVHDEKRRRKLQTPEDLDRLVRNGGRSKIASFLARPLQQESDAARSIDLGQRAKCERPTLQATVRYLNLRND